MIRAVFLTMAILVLALVSAHASPLVNPQPEHELLKRFAGDWRFVRSRPLGHEVAPVVVGQGTLTAGMVGEFFVVGHWVGQVYGSEYAGVMSLGYDIEREEYTGDWIDSIISYRWKLSGSIDEERDELVLLTVGPGPRGGTAKFRERYQFHSPDDISIVGEMHQDDAWVNIVNTRLTRLED
jgi:hypothetical protein